MESAISPGSKLSHFEIIEKLGEGGMGTVYKARDQRLNRLVAIKVFPETPGAYADREARFVQEAKAASALNHPNIITIHETDTADGVTFIAMEYLDGQTLDQIISGKELRYSEVLTYAVPITDALAAAHGIGIIHRDLKPANIMVAPKGHVKVLDFGLAKFVQPASAVHSNTTASLNALRSEEGSIIGTVAYMSPEQAEGRPIDARSDIFSFGIVLYEMLTGSRPFTGDTKISTLGAIINKEPKPASELVKDLPHDLDRIVARCLRKNPERRFQTMADLHAALQDLQDESDSGMVAAAFKTRRGIWFWAAILAVVVLGTAGIWLSRRHAAPLEPQRVVPVTTYAGSEMYPSFSPDGNQVAFSWGGEKSDNSDLYVKLLGDTNALRITNSPAADEHPAWSPDGKRIAFERFAAAPVFFAPTGPMGIFTISPLGGNERKLTDFPANGPMSWSPNQKWLAVTSNTSELNGVFLVPIEGGEPRRITNPKAPDYDLAPAFSHDGRRLAYAACSGGRSCDVFIQDLDKAFVPSSRPRRITKDGITIWSLAWSQDGESVIYNGALSGGRLSYLFRAGLDSGRAPERLEIAGPNAYYPAIATTGNRLIFSRVLTNSDIWRYQVGGTATPFIVSSLDDDCPQFSPDGKRIAFSSSRTGEAMEIWVADADGSGVVQMTNRSGRHQGSPRWSPDGRWIVFDSQGQDGHWHIFVIDASGGRPRRITAQPGNENIPSFSRDGKWIYFRSDQTGRNEIWRTPFAGGAAQQITTNGGFTALEGADGQTLFYTKTNGSPLFSLPLSGGPERQVLPYVSFRAFVPMDDGIYFIGQRGEDGQFPLQRFEFTTGATRSLTNTADRMDYGLTASADRRTFLFSKHGSFGADLITIENFP